MNRPRYTEGEKAQAYITLASNGDNLKRTARDLNIPPSTLRKWRDQWQAEGPPEQAVLTKELDSFVENARRVRDLALVQLEAKVGDAKPNELVNIVGMLDDKITRATGLDQNKNQHVHLHLPAADELREALSGFIGGAIGMAQKRQEEIVDAEIVVQKALPAHT